MRGCSTAALQFRHHRRWLFSPRNVKLQAFISRVWQLATHTQTHTLCGSELWPPESWCLATILNFIWKNNYTYTRVLDEKKDVFPISWWPYLIPSTGQNIRKRLSIGFAGHAVLHRTEQSQFVIVSSTHSQCFSISTEYLEQNMCLWELFRSMVATSAVNTDSNV